MKRNTGNDQADDVPLRSLFSCTVLKKPLEGFRFPMYTACYGASSRLSTSEQ